MSEDLDIWERVFGGKDTLRLSIGAHSFRIRKTKSGKTASFGYGEGMRVSISKRGNFPFYLIRVYKQGKEIKGMCRWSSTTGGIRDAVEDLTGLVLNCFE
jgi:hypothetical protein